MNRPVAIKPAADELGMSVYSLRKAAKDGTLPCLKIGGRYLFYTDQIFEVLRAQAQSNVKQYGGE